MNHADRMSLSPRTAVLSVLLALLLIPAFVASYNNLLAVHRIWHPFTVGDWLINYAGGFVRRGLMGEILMLLSNATGLSISTLLFALQIGLLVAFFACVVRLIFAQRNVWPFLLLTVSPVILMFQVHDAAGGFRKEQMHIVLLAIVAVAAVSTDTNRFRRIIRIAALAYPLLILSHEMLAIYMPYLVALALCRLGADRRTVLELGLLTLPSVAAFGLAYWYTGSPQQVAAICASLTSAPLSDCAGNTAVGWLSKSLDYGHGAVMARVREGFYISFFLQLSGLCLIGFLPAIARVRLLWRHQLALLAILMSVAGTLLLFTVALDWGRFIYVHCVSLFLVLLALQTSEPAPAIEPNRGPIGAALHRWRYLWLSAYAGFAWLYATTWRVMHYY